MATGTLMEHAIISGHELPGPGAEDLLSVRPGIGTVSGQMIRNWLEDIAMDYSGGHSSGVDSTDGFEKARHARAGSDTQSRPHQLNRDRSARGTNSKRRRRDLSDSSIIEPMISSNKATKGSDEPEQGPYKKRPRRKTREDRYDVHKQHSRKKKQTQRKTVGRSSGKRAKWGTLGTAQDMMDNFAAENIHAERISLRPTIGIFGNGRTATADPLSDLTFNNMRFLKEPRYQAPKGMSKSQQRHRRREDREQEEVSAFFPEARQQPMFISIGDPPNREQQYQSSISSSRCIRQNPTSSFGDPSHDEWRTCSTHGWPQSSRDLHLPTRMDRRSSTPLSIRKAVEASGVFSGLPDHVRAIGIPSTDQAEVGRNIRIVRYHDRGTMARGLSPENTTDKPQTNDPSAEAAPEAPEEAVCPEQTVRDERADKDVATETEHATEEQEPVRQAASTLKVRLPGDGAAESPQQGPARPQSTKRKLGEDIEASAADLAQGDEHNRNEQQQQDPVQGLRTRPEIHWPDFHAAPRMLSPYNNACSQPGRLTTCQTPFSRTLSAAESSRSLHTRNPMDLPALPLDSGFWQRHRAPEISEYEPTITGSSYPSPHKSLCLRRPEMPAGGSQHRLRTPIIQEETGNESWSEYIERIERESRRDHEEADDEYVHEMSSHHLEASPNRQRALNPAAARFGTQKQAGGVDIVSSHSRLRPKMQLSRTTLHDVLHDTLEDTHRAMANFWRPNPTL